MTQPVPEEFTFVDFSSKGDNGDSYNQPYSEESYYQPQYYNSDADVRERITSSGFATQYLEQKGFGWLLEQEDDEEVYNTTILEELEIDVRDIYYKIRCVLFPLPSLGFKRQIISESPDFWGPLFIVLSYALVSVVGQFQAISWILSIWLIGSFFVFILTRVLGGEVTYSQCLGVIGYSLLPLIIIGVALPIFSSLTLVAFLLKCIGILWATYSAGTLLVNDNLSTRRPLVLYPIFLLYIYFYSIYSGV